MRALIHRLARHAAAAATVIAAALLAMLAGVLRLLTDSPDAGRSQ